MASFVIAGLLVLVGLSGFAWWRLTVPRATTHTAGSSAVPVTVAVAKVQDVSNYLEELGTVQTIDSVNVQSRVMGEMQAIYFTPGQDVKQGQPLFLIDPRPYQATLDQAKGQLARDQAILKQAQMDLARYQKLEKENSIATQQADDQVYAVQQDQGTVQLDQAAVENAALNLQYCHVAAPISGRTGLLLVDVGNLVGGSNSNNASRNSTSTTSSASTTLSGQTTNTSGSSLVSIAQMQPIYVNFTVPQQGLDEIRQNQSADSLEVDAYSQAGTLLEKGKLTVIDNQVNAATGTVMMQATFANADERLWPGEFVRIRLIVSIRHDTVTVPAQAVIAGPNGSYAYVIVPGNQAQRVDVQVAALQDGLAVIQRGIAGGAKVVTAGQLRLSNGVAVTIQQSQQGPSQAESGQSAEARKPSQPPKSAAIPNLGQPAPAGAQQRAQRLSPPAHDGGAHEGPTG